MLKFSRRLIFAQRTHHLQSRQLFALCVLIVGLASASIATFGQKLPRPQLILDVSSTVVGTVRVYFDQGRGFRERDSSTATAQDGDEPTRLHLPLGFGRLAALRLAPLDRPGSLVIENVTLRVPGRPDIDIGPSSLRPVSQTSHLGINGNKASIAVDGNGNEAQLNIALPVQINMSRAEAILLDLPRRSIDFAIWVTAWSLLIGMISKARFAARVAPLRKHSRTYPALMVFGAALIATLVSSAPVAFMGRSLLAPGNWAHLLYDRCPIVPGPSDCVMEDTMGADVGAMYWQHFPNVVVQERAVRDFKEFPLWNRYNSAGLSIIGQGQMMLGDPLNWLQIFFGVDAWSFDLKFIFLRVLFSTALGLSVLSLTGSVRPAALVSLLSPFIGYFVYRFNHPAIFTLCYTPLIALCWINLTLATRALSVTAWLCGLVVSSWLVINSGTVKEAYMAALMLNLIGALHFVLETRSSRPKSFWPLSLFIVLAGVIFVGISAPVVGSLYESLRNSWTVYDVPSVQQMNPFAALTLADNYFARELLGRYFVSTNALIFTACLVPFLFVRSLKDKAQRTFILAYGAGALFLYALAFGIVPGSLLKVIPFIQSIHHIDNTFSTILLIPTILLAGVGFHIVDELVREGRTEVLFKAVGTLLVILTMMLSVYAFQFGVFAMVNVFRHAIVVLPAALLVLWLLARNNWKRLSHFGVALAIVALFVVLGRTAMYPTANHALLFEPAQRLSLRAQPPFIERLQANLADAPARVIGLGTALFPGYSAALALETIHGPDAVMIRRYRELTEALELPYAKEDWFMRFEPDNLSAHSRALDFLNVKYFVASRELSGLPRIGGDTRLSVFERPHPAPRAFFTSYVETYSSVKALASRIKNGAAGPFVAIDESDPAAMARAEAFVRPANRPANWVSARNYAMTANTTAFTIEAPSAGVIYLGEANIPGDFEVTVNGIRVPYFAANHAFKAIAVSGPGIYRVSFRYWPARLTMLIQIALASAAAGLVLLAFVYWWCRRNGSHIAISKAI